MNNKILIGVFCLIVIVSVIVASLMILQSEQTQDYLKEREIKNTINFMRANNIQIWGMDYCSWCRKQLEEFGDHQEELKEFEIYKNCEDIKNLERCQELFSQSIGTPFFTMNGKYLTSGYRTLNEVREVYKYRR